MRHSWYLLLCSILFCSTLIGGERLREAAGNRLLVGCAIATVDLGNPKLVALVTEQFGCITPEYELMPGLMVGDDGKFTFEGGDRVVAFAEAQHMLVFGHMLVHGTAGQARKVVPARAVNPGQGCAHRRGWHAGPLADRLAPDGHDWEGPRRTLGNGR